jgi:Uma2 family endonuclease
VAYRDTMSTPDGGERITAQPLPPTPSSSDFEHPLTIDDYAALGEADHGRVELQEGSLVMSPSPTPDHNVAGLALAMALAAQLPAHLEVVPDVDVDLALVGRGEPATARRPDLVVIDRSVRPRVRAEGGMIRASEVLVAIEIVSAGSRRTDNIVKRAEYADAGIPHYWIVDLDDPVTVLACHLTDEFGYRDNGVVKGRFVSSVPFEVTVDLERLV